MIKKLYSNSSTIVIITLFIIIAGLIRFFNLPVALYPDTSRPALFVNIAEKTLEVESFRLEYGNDIEAKLGALREVEQVEGFYKQGRAEWLVTFEWNSETESAESRVREALSTFESQFPQDWPKFRYYFRSNSNASVYYSVYSENIPEDRLREIIKSQLQSKLQKIDGIDEVWITKPFEDLVEIKLNYDTLLSLGIGPEEVINRYNEKHYDRALPPLKPEGSKRFSLLVDNRTKSFDELENLWIKKVGSRDILLRDIASIKITKKAPKHLFKGNGKRAMIIGANIKPDGNIAKVCDDFKDLVTHNVQTIDPSIEVTELMNPSQFIKSAIKNIGEAVLLGVLIATLIIFLFLGSLRLTIVIGISIPLSLIGGFIVMSLAGIELNLISLGAMALAVGMVVDGSIVVLENIYRHLNISHPSTFLDRLEVIYNATMEVKSAVIASLLTTIIVFAPLSFTSPLANAILGDLAKVMVCVLVISVLVTIFMVPAFMNLVHFQNSQKKRGLYKIPYLFQSMITLCRILYLKALEQILAQRKFQVFLILTILITLVFSSYLLSQKVKREILATPDSDKVWFMISFKDQEYEIDESDARIHQYEKIIETEFSDDLSHYLSYIHSKGGNILCSLKDKKLIKSFTAKLEERFTNTATIHFRVRPWNPTSLEIPSPPFMKIRALGQSNKEKHDTLEKVQDFLKDDEHISWVSTDPNLRMTEDYTFSYDQELIKAINEKAKQKISERNIEQLISLFLKGRKLDDLRFKDEKLLGVHIGIEHKELLNPDDILNIFINIDDNYIPLRHILKINPSTAPKEIYTNQGEIEFTLIANLKDMYQNDKDDIRAALIDKIKNIPNINANLLAFEDTEKEINENIISLVYALILALGLIAIVISLQFGGISQTLIIMCAIPLGFIGVSFSLYAFDSTLSVNSMLGLILLCGTAVNNSIIFIDFFNQQLQISGSSSIKDLIVRTANLRFQPIIITTATTILGMAPIALGFGSGGKILQPLGIAVCGGLGISTILTLLVVPLILFLKEENYNSRDRLIEKPLKQESHFYEKI